MEFVEAEFPNSAQHALLYTNALTCRLVLLNVQKENDRSEGEVVISKMLTAFDGMKRSLQQQQRQCHHLLPPTDIEVFEGHAMANIGTFYHKIRSDESLPKAKFYYEKARTIFEGQGDQLGVMTINNLILNVEAEIGGEKRYLSDAINSKVELKKYELFTKEFGADNTKTIEAGVQVVLALFKEFRTIEAERLLSKLIVTSRRVLGESHGTTQFCMATAKMVKRRRVFLKKEGGDDDEIDQDKVYDALRYTDDGKCVLQGPIENKPEYDPRIDGEVERDESAEIFEVDATDVILSKGLPVVCIGLQKAAHLNGKIGDRRDFDEKTGRYALHFEDKALKPVMVKPENLRIVFELPELE